MDEVHKQSQHKLFYRPLEIAIRWCGLISSEQNISNQIANGRTMTATQARQWPCLEQKLDLLWDALRNGDLPFGSLGITAKPGETVDPAYLTIRHSDLKAWFGRFHPHEKPSFLFTPTERHAIPAFTFDIYQTFFIEVEALKLQLVRERAHVKDLKTEVDKARTDRLYLLTRLRRLGNPTDRNENAYLRLIGALIRLLLGKSPNGKKYSAFESQASIISILLATNRGKRGFTKRTLEEKFAAANRSIDVHD